MSLESGQTIDGKYKVGRLIGEGGMGTVYEGENTRIGRRVAIKILHANVASMPEFAERFEREARVAARVGSPNVCDVLDLGDLPNGDRYIVMEFLDGMSFEDRLVQKGKLTPQELAPIAFELLEGLGTMHNARVVHRDLKPANVFLSKGPGGRGEIVKILDFGVAKLLPFEGEVGTMTKTGSMMGTPLYMSPEQARGARDVDGRTDLYAASVMFYRALCGQLPYMAETLNELLFKIVLEDPKPLSEMVPGIDESFAEIVHKGLARDPDLRFSSAREYQEALAFWGKTQGRTSLQFAVTLPSDPPPFLSSTPKQSAAKKAESKPTPAPAVTGASTAAGTPIAWEGNGRIEGSETQVSARGPMGSSPDAGNGATGDKKVISQPGSDVSPVASTVVSAGSPDIPPAQATTAPSAAELAARERSGSKNKLMMGAVAAVALCLGVGIVVAKTSGSKTEGSTPPASVEGPKDPPPAPTSPATTAATTTTPPPPTTDPVDTAAPTSTTSPTTATMAAKPTQHVTTNRTADPKASAAPPATTSAAPATTAATPPSSSAKPASSARKFRTNID